MLGSIIGAAGGALGGVFGGLSKNRMLKDQIAAVEAKKRENQDWYDRRYNEDSTQRADAQAMLTQTAEAIKGRNRQAAGVAAVTGGTEESVAATKAANAQAMADATSSIVQAGEARKDSIEKQYRAANDAYDEQIRSLKSQKQGVLD
ncbi:MAG: hypothetical protein SOU82_00805, partial [Alloprevotella sp.]|nr:hypothetical protein [Alloprevotella sp.]